VWRVHRGHADMMPGQRRAVGGDKGFDSADFVEGCRELGVGPHVAQNLHRPQGSAIDGRTTRGITPKPREPSL
jgi:hypothetical protein